MTSPGPNDAITDVPGIEVGHYTDLDNATGCTVVIARAGARPGVFQPGGAPGTLDTDLAVAENAVQDIHAVLLTGGSVLGLESAAGVRRYLQEQGVGLPLMPDKPPLPIVMGAVVFDLPIGEFAHPTADNGYVAAANASSGPVAQGSVGVGTGCTVAKTGQPNTSLKGGVGTASLVHESGLIVGALVATNAVGDIVDPAGGELVAGPRGEQPGDMQRSSEMLLNRSVAEFEALLQARAPAPKDDAGAKHYALCDRHKRQVAQRYRQADLNHGIGRPREDHQSRLHPGDGDTVFTLATGEIDVTSIPALLTLTGTMAAEAVARATLRSVREARSLAEIPAVSDWLSNTLKY